MSCHLSNHRRFPALGALAVAVLLSSIPASAAPLALTVKSLEPPAAPSAAPAESVEPTVAPVPPSSLAGQSVLTDTAVLLWKDNSNSETGFIIEGRAAGDPTFSPLGDPVPANSTTAEIIGLSAGVTYDFRVRATNASGDSAPSNAVTVTALGSDDCIGTSTIMCLNNNEFRVQALFVTNNGLSGEATMVKLVADSGYLWFFSESNIEAVVKVLDGCATNSHFWVFAGGLTDVRVLLTVTDTMVGIPRFYNNPFGKAFLPIQDTVAFATCG